MKISLSYADSILYVDYRSNCTSFDRLLFEIVMLCLASCFNLVLVGDTDSPTYIRMQQYLNGLVLLHFHMYNYAIHEYITSCL